MYATLMTVGVTYVSLPARISRGQYNGLPIYGECARLANIMALRVQLSL